MTDSPEQRDHPSLAKYPDGPTKFYTRDGVTWRVPARRDRDEAVAVPVEDLVQARGAVFQLKKFIAAGAGSESQVWTLGWVLQGTSSEPAPQTRAEVVAYLDGLTKRLTGSLPYW